MMTQLEQTLDRIRAVQRETLAELGSDEAIAWATLTEMAGPSAAAVMAERSPRRLYLNDLVSTGCGDLDRGTPRA